MLEKLFAFLKARLRLAKNCCPACNRKIGTQPLWNVECDICRGTIDISTIWYDFRHYHPKPPAKVLHHIDDMANTCCGSRAKDAKVE